MKKTFIYTLMLMAVVSVYLLLKPSNSQKEDIEYSHLVEEVLKSKELNENNYFVGNAKENYLMLGNDLWRIIRVDNKNNLLLIKDSKVRSLGSAEYASKDSYDYKDSYIKELLNTWYETELKSYDKYIVENDYCSAYDDNCLSTTKEHIGLISEEEYKNTFNEEESFLTNSYLWWIISNNMYDQYEEVYYSGVVLEDGTINKKDVYDVAGIRPVITIDGNLEVTGKGTVEEPFLSIE